MRYLESCVWRKLIFNETDSDAYLWSSLECTMAIICATIPSFRPLISHYFPGLLNSSASSPINRSGGSGGTNGSSNSAQKPKRPNVNSFSLAEMGTSGRSHGLQKLGDNDSEERINASRGSI